MRCGAAIVLTLLGSLAACRSEPEPRRCDLDALTKLGHELAPMSIAEQAEHVWPGIIAACDRAVPIPLNNYFDPKSLGDVLPRERAAWTVMQQHRACPKWDEIIRAHEDTPWDSRAVSIFEQCDFARYDVVAADEIAGIAASGIMTWATHQWLLEQGLDARAAVPVTRALFALDQIESWRVAPLDKLQYPKAHGVPLPDAMPIYVTREQIRFEGHQGFSLEDGQPSFMFGERMTEEAERELAGAKQQGRVAILLIVGDVGAAMSTVLFVLRVGRSAGFHRFGFFVAPEAYVPTYIPVTLARDELLDNVELDPKRTPMLMTIELTPEGLTLGRGWNDRSKLEAHALTDVDAVAHFADMIRSEDPNARFVVLSIAGPVTLDQALAVIEAARGPQCSESGAGCVLPEVVLRSENAHRYPSPRTSAPPHPIWLRP